MPVPERSGPVQITRRHTTVGSAPYSGATRRFYSAKPSLNSSADSGVDQKFEVAETWSIEAAEILEERCLVPTGVPVCLKEVREDDVPSWLWRHNADREALERLCPADRTRSESGLQAIVDRIAGGWTYQGWKSGYFDSDGDAQAFYDEIRWLLFNQRLSPEIAAWRHEGVFWAYGIEETPSGAITDYRTGGMRAIGPDDTPPHGAVINGVVARAEFSGGGSLWDLFQREGALRRAGCALGVNLSTPNSGFSAEAAFEFNTVASQVYELRIGGQTISRRLTIDAIDDNSNSILRRHASTDASVDLSEAGRTLAHRHLTAIADACQAGNTSRQLDPTKNPALRFAIVAARGAMVSEAMINRLLRLLDGGTSFVIDDLVGSPCRRQRQDNTTIVVRADDTLLDQAVGDDKQAAAVLDATSLAAWTKGSCGLNFATTTDGWNTCRDSEAIRSAAGDGDYIFLDDTSVSRITLNIPAYVTPEGSIDIADLRHASMLATIALDIAIAKNALATPRLARRNWNFRPIALSPTGLASALIALGYAYDSRDGRIIAARLCGLITGSAWATSALLAEELGAFPTWQKNAKGMEQVLRNHQRAAMGEPGCYEGLGWPPFAHPDRGCSAVDGIDTELTEIWKDAITTGQRAGYRNAHISVIAALEAENRLLDCHTPGLEPNHAVLRFEKLPGGGFRKVVDQSIIRGLRSLGYDGKILQGILQHVVGRGTLVGAPGINHENLRKRGFTADALRVVEAGLNECLDITMAFNPWALGESFCTRMLGLSASAMEADGFDLLTALGFSDAAIEAANVFCCGANTLEGAPGLDTDDLPVFDCATEQGQRGRRRIEHAAIVRMIAAVQPLISGGVGHAVTLPGTSTVADCRETFLMAWRLGVKSLVLNIEPSDGMILAEVVATVPENRENKVAKLRVIDGGAETAKPVRASAPVAPPSVTLPAFGTHEIAPGAVSQALTLAHTAHGLAEARHATESRRSAMPATLSSDPGTIPETIPETIIADPATLSGIARDASPSRGPLSDPARSTASAASSPDAVVEQRQV
jgi:ribonucleoside-diphosphate reductase alpha chain